MSIDEPWLLTGGVKTGSVRLRVNPADYPAGVVPALTTLRKVGRTVGGSDVFEVSGEDAAEAEAPFLLTDVSLESR